VQPRGWPGTARTARRRWYATAICTPSTCWSTTTGGRLLDWTAAVIAEPAYDIAFTTLLLRHPPLTAPGPLRPVITAAGRHLARRFHASYQAAGLALPEPARLEWHTALHALRILVEVESWQHQPGPDINAGHPFLTIGPAAAHALSRTTGTAVSWP
jgi:hypothetical protein